MNLAEDSSILGSMDNDNMSQAGSLEPAADSGSARNSGLHEPSEAGPTGELPNGSHIHSRKPMWNGGHGGPYQEGHPTTAAHLLHQHPHLVGTVRAYTECRQIVVSKPEM